MKIALRGGHNFVAVGSKGLIDEVEEDRKVYKAVQKYLEMYGEDVLDVTPGNVDSKSDLKYGVTEANEWGADLFVSIHFNKAFGSYKDPLGTEAWINPNESISKKIAEKITDNLKDLGFKNRGVKNGLAQGYYEIKYTKMPAIIVEVCFVESEKDVETYLNVGPDKVGEAIAKGILGYSINEKVPLKFAYGIVNADILNVRQGPGLNYKILDKFKKGTRIKIAGEVLKDWYSIYYGNHGAYVAKKYITLE